MPNYWKERTTRKPRKAVARKGKSTKKRITTKSVSPMIKLYVKKAISARIENKSTAVTTYTQNVLTRNTFGTLNPFITGVGGINTDLISPFLLTQGVGEGQRVGNEIMVKKWVLRGMIIPASLGLTYLDGGALVINMYLGCLVNTAAAFDLSKFYQSGNTSIPYNGQMAQRLFPVNKDHYRIFWHKQIRFLSYLDYPNGPYNSSNQKFYVNVLKYLPKDLKLKYDDNDDGTPQNVLPRNLKFFCSVQDLNSDISTGLGLPADSHASIIMTSYGEYEDA